MSISTQVRPLTKHGWGASIGLDLKSLSANELVEVGQLAATNLILVARNQRLSTRDEVRICNIIGKVEQLPVEIHHRCPRDSEGNSVPIIQRVTGQKDSHGRPTGLFYHNQELDWHVNRASSFEDRKPLVWLRAVQGVEGSRTSWINSRQAFSDLSDSMKSELRSMKGFYGYRSGLYSPVTDFKNHINKSPFPIVYHHPLNGDEALYFPFHQIFGIEGMSEREFSRFSEVIKQHLLKDQYIYHHDWCEGDIVLSEQWCTLHKRWPVDVSERLLHRITMDYRGYTQPGQQPQLFANRH